MTGERVGRVTPRSPLAKEEVMRQGGVIMGQRAEALALDFQPALAFQRASGVGDLASMLDRLYDEARQPFG